MSDENKAIVQRFFDELWNSGNPDAIDEVMDAGCDGDICYPRPGGSLPSAEEVFPAAHSALYSDSVLTRLEEMTKTHPELSRSIVKNLIIHHEGNFRGIVKSAAKKFRTAIPDVKCTIEEMALKMTRSGHDGHLSARSKLMIPAPELLYVGSRSPSLV
jgi:hypothetical protein